MDAPRRPSRFKPVRAGIINLWDYVNEVFLFADGRLVLRGHNGAGKTKALEVLVPFVLDGRMDARRLDPFSGEARTMKENLLFRGSEAAYGYVWMEFARSPGRGEPVERVTIGVGMHARKHKEDVTPWFFLTDGSGGAAFHLVVEGRPLTRAELTQAIGEERVTEKARDYRDMIAARLFGLNRERYEQMLELVLTLRKPQLSKDLDPPGLSKVLTRGLRPLDDELLAQVAKSFNDLELAQRELERLGNADATLQTFLTLYRGHVRAVAKHRVDQARTAVHAVDRCATELTSAKGALEAAKEREAVAIRKLESTKSNLREARAKKEGLLESPAYKALAQLKSLADHLASAAGSVEDAAEALDLLRKDLQELAADAASADAERDDAARGRELIASQVRTAAQGATVEWEDGDDAHGADAVATLLKARIGGRRADVAAIEREISRVQDAQGRVTAADDALQTAETALTIARQDVVDAERAVVAHREAWASRLHTWADARPPGTLEPGDVGLVLGAAQAFGESEAPAPRDVLRDRLTPRIERIQQHGFELEQQRQEAMKRDRELEAHTEAILAERDDAPVATHTRPASRAGRAGAPLWRLVRFRDDVRDETRGGIEAALEASGILDAWVTPSDDPPSGEVLDALLVSGAADGDRATLAEVLDPEEHPEIGPERILAVLRGIAVGHAERAATFVTEAGAYGLGPLRGRYEAERARYIGATAREAHRRRRVEEIRREREALAAACRELDDQLALLTDRRVAYDAAIKDLPSTAELTEALREVDTRSGAVRAARAAERSARDTLDHWKREVLARLDALRGEASLRALPADADALRAVTLMLEETAQRGAELVVAIRRVARADTQAGESRRRHSKRQEELPSRQDQLARHTETRDRLRVELETVKKNLGSDAATLQTELEGVARRIEELEADERADDREKGAAADARSAAQQTATNARDAVSRAEGDRRTAIAALAPLVDAELALVLELGAEMIGRAPPTGARSAELDALMSRLDAVTRGMSGSDERRKTALAQVTSSLAQLPAQLGPHFRDEWRLDDDIIRVTIADDEGPNSVAAFAQKLSARKLEQEALLTVREREVFEDALLSALCRQLHLRTTAARDLVRQMDHAMRERRMSSGKSVGVSWPLRDNLSAEQRQAVKSLEFDPANLAPEALDGLRVHFSREVKSARAAHPDRSYRDILSSVLDYREWRGFVLHLVDADGHDELLTKNRHSKLSGGEKAASLHIPLFAAAHAQFSSARETCPRLIALDEAFAGIDSQGKPELMSLSVEFDLDLFMTGFDLWVTFPSVPMASHYDLVHVPSEHTVSALLLLWDGGQIVEGETAEALIEIAAGA